MQERQVVLAIMGPTASGKTALAIELANHKDLQLISVDSAMVYRGLDIGTAKPSAEILEKYPHSLVDIREPEEDYSVREFYDDANAIVARSLDEGKIPVMVGGSMMYFNAFKYGLTDLPTKDPKIRSGLEQEKDRHGLNGMYAKLVKVDPVAAERIHPNNWPRIERALEVFAKTGKPISDHWQDVPKKTVAERHDCEYMEFALTDIPRDVLHERIDQRLTQMIENGLFEEIRQLRNRKDLSPSNLSVQAVGYKQVWEMLDDNPVNDWHADARERVLNATRQIARRQLVWLRGWQDIPEEHVLPCDPAVERLICALDS